MKNSEKTSMTAPTTKEWKPTLMIRPSNTIKYYNHKAPAKKRYLSRFSKKKAKFVVTINYIDSLIIEQ